jgi:hypothetical protein
MIKALLFTYVFIIIFFILSTPAYSSDWLQIEDSPGVEKNYIDLDSVKYQQHIVTFWTKNTDRKGEDTKMSFSINCKNGNGAIRDIIIYSSNETVLKSYSYKEGKLLWGNIASHSFMNSFKKLLCKDWLLTDVPCQ